MGVCEEGYVTRRGGKEIRELSEGTMDLSVPY